ncbi:MAG TPA: SPOR domain-containing protein, partial [Steroidobacteraceae bacterium]|nr:SPOR domain-containing protein [Steroidobacteraceae bacterium]
APAAPAVAPAAATVASGAPPAAGAAAPPVPTPTSSPYGFAVQLGAFSTQAAAANAWQALSTRFAGELRGMTPNIVSGTAASGQLFRLQAAVADEARARALCDALRKQSQACVPLSPR